MFSDNPDTKSNISERSWTNFNQAEFVVNYFDKDLSNILTLKHGNVNMSLENFVNNMMNWHIKGYLCYKTITSQNVPSKAQIKNYLFRRKIMFRSQDIQVFVFLTIPWFTKSVTSQWVLVHKIRCIFEYIFWTTNHEVTKLGQLIDINKDNNFQ